MKNEFEDEIYFPKLQDTIWVRECEVVVNYNFLGFVYEYMLLENANGDTIALSLYEPLILFEYENRVLSIEEEYREFIKRRSEKTQFVTFNGYINKMTNYAAQQIEEVSLIDLEFVSIRRLGDIVNIPVAEIDQITIPFRNNYALTGFLIGLGIDALIIYGWSSADPLKGSFGLNFDD